MEAQSGALRQDKAILCSYSSHEILVFLAVSGQRLDRRICHPRREWQGIHTKRFQPSHRISRLWLSSVSCKNRQSPCSS